MDKENRKTKVIFDTNALLEQFRSNVDLEKELNRLLGTYEIIIPSSVLSELNNVKDRYVKAARKLTERYHIEATELEGDDAIIHIAEELSAMVVTNDKELRKRLKKLGITVLFMRQGKYLKLDTP